MREGSECSHSNLAPKCDPSPPRLAESQPPLALQNTHMEIFPSSPSNAPASNTQAPGPITTPGIAGIPSSSRYDTVLPRSITCHIYLFSAHDLLETQKTPETPSHSTASYDSPIYKVPLEVLIQIFELATLSRTREDRYTLLSLTHVCPGWRIPLVNHPQAWTTIFATHQDRRSFVQACLGRSQDKPLEATVDINEKVWWDRSACSCKNNGFGILLPNEETPCEWHYLFELLAQPSVLGRIQFLRITTSSKPSLTPSIVWKRRLTIPSLELFDYPSFQPALELKERRFFHSTFPQLTTLVWKDEATELASLLFSASHPLPSGLKSVTFEGRWQPSLPLSRVNNLTSFTIKKYFYVLPAEEFRMFLSNNLSLVLLEVDSRIRGETEGPPVVLSNLKSLSVDCDPEHLSTILRVPAFQNLSTLRISLAAEHDDLYAIRATGGEVSLSAKASELRIQEHWQHLTGYAEPTLRHVSVHDERLERIPFCDSCAGIATLMVDARVVDIGLTYSIGWDGVLWDKLKLLGELEVIHFEVYEEMHPYEEDLARIADLVEHRFKNGRPLHAVEIMVVNDDGEVGGLQDASWNPFLKDRPQGLYGPRRTDVPLNL